MVASLLFRRVVLRTAAASAAGPGEPLGTADLGPAVQGTLPTILPVGEIVHRGNVVAIELDGAGQFQVKVSARRGSARGGV